MGNHGLRVIMFWDGGRPFTEWEKKCIRRSEELFDIEWLDPNGYDTPSKQFALLAGPSDWARWIELQTPYTLWTDCDVYWHRYPDGLNDMIRCDSNGGGFRPNDAVVWSGAHPELAEYVMGRIHSNGAKFAKTGKFLGEFLRRRRRDRGLLWDFFPPGYCQHKAIQSVQKVNLYAKHLTPFS